MIILFLSAFSVISAVKGFVFTAADDGARITFTKEFPNSQPDYYSITVGEDGRTVYRTAPDDNAPLEFSISADTASEIFRLAEKLNWFKGGNVESHRRVANMGKKTLSYQTGGERHESVFNHTELPEALALTAIFERISSTEQHLIRLENLVRFDRLGIMKELLQVEMAVDQNRLLGTGQLVPILEKIRNNRSVANIAKERAVQILGKIQAGKQ
ncbi:MAG: hypothetical protein HYX72_00625 [Acidobacteria bacterium]|nr:hypothetical protein [Acidobacteriota bacterium]